MSIIRYRYKADKNFESVKIDGMNCSLGELKRLIAARSSRSGTHHPKDDYDLIISNANTHEEYKDNSDLIPRNTSVIVARRIRGTYETLTPLSNQKPVVSSDDIVNDILLPAIMNQNQNLNQDQPTAPSSFIETKSIPLEKLTETTSNASVKEKTEDQMIKEIQMGSQARYVTQQPSYRTNLFVCHNCKQPGHIKSQCPLLSSSSNSTGNNISASSSTTVGDHSSKGDGTQSTMSGSNKQSMPHSSHIITRHAPYQFPYHRGNRSHHRGSGHPRGEPLPKKTTGIPRDRLIPVPKHIPGALRDQTGASVVPRQMAELYVERIEKKADAQRARQADDKGVLPSVPSTLKSTDDNIPPDDLLCPLCKRVYDDAVITPCCNFSFCDACIRTALIESLEHECPHCHRKHVAIDQINPNLFLRTHVVRWRERQNKSSYSHISTSQHTSHILDQDLDTTPTRTSGTSNLSNETDEYDPTIVSTTPIAPIQKAPIIIKMQPHRKSQSPQPFVSTRPADMTFEDGKTSDSEQPTSTQKDVNVITNETTEETTNPPFDTFLSLITSENEKSEHETPPSQLPPLNTNYASSPPATNSIVPHYYPAPTHHNVMYPNHIPAPSSNGLYPIQSNYYPPPPPMAIRYPGGGIHHYPQFAPAPPVHQHHPIVPPQHAPMNGYHVPTFHPHPNAPYASTSTFITQHHQTATQPISNAITNPLSENEFYIKQRYFQRIQRSPSRRRSRSSSYSSYSSSDSRSSSRSRQDRRRRASRSRSRRRIKSPIRDTRRERRSSSYRNQRRPTNPIEPHPSKYRRPSPRPARDHERRRSPRPPPTVQQSTQRTIVYMHETSHSRRDRRRTKSPVTKTEPIPSPITVPTTLLSRIESVVEETSNELTSKSDKKHKKHHHKKHRHQSSKSKKHRRSKDKEEKTIVDTTTSVIEIQS